MPTLAAANHLLGLQGVNAEEVRSLLVSASSIEDATRQNPSALEGRFPGRIIANLFFEDSTRTRTSFTIAARRLGAAAVDLSSAGSSLSKGETLIDTAKTVEAMGVSAIVVRAKQSGAAALIARHVASPVVNAGDGKHEHPTQGLLDIYTMARASGRDRAGAGANAGRRPFDMSGFTVAIVGDVVSSRVARSNIAGLSALGAKVVCVGPPSFAPNSLESLGVEVTHDFASVLPRADAVMMLRIQFERHGEGGAPTPGAGQGGSGSGGGSGGGGTLSSIREYREFYALTEARANTMKPGAIVMHPGPMNRGIEVDADVADGPRSVITQQVATGVIVRMAVLERAFGTPS